MLTFPKRCPSFPLRALCGSPTPTSTTVSRRGFLPAERITLKRRAAAKPPADMAEILEAFCALDSRFEENRAQWAQIVAANEPCTAEQLALTGRDLLAQGLRGPAVGKRLALLLEAVWAEPQLNNAGTLLALSAALDGLDS